MTAWRAIGLVWRREVRERARSKVFMIGTIATLLIITAIFVIPPLVNPGPEKVSVGHVGAGSEPIVSTVQLLVATDDAIELELIAYDDLAAGEAAIEDGTIEALLVDGTELVTLGQGSFASNEGSSLLQQAASANAVEQLVVETGMTPEEVVELLTGQTLRPRTLSGVDADDPTREIVAYAGLMLMYMAILMYGTWTLAGVTEEKANRVVEILVSTIQPWQLLTGKVLGIGALAIVQFAVTVVYGLVLSRVTGSVDLADVPLDSAAMVILWFILGFTIYSVMFATVGALVSRAEDASSASTPVTIAAVGSFMITIATLNDPSGLTAKIATFVPFTAPYVVPVRFALDAIAWWEIVLAALLTIASAYLLIRIAGRIYRGALLSYGARVKLRDAWSGSGDA